MIGYLSHFIIYGLISGFGLSSIQFCLLFRADCQRTLPVPREFVLFHIKIINNDG